MGYDRLWQADQDTRTRLFPVRPGVDGAGGGDPTVHGFDKAPRDRQAEADALGLFAGGLAAAELVEDPLQLFGRYALAFVLDADDDSVAVLVGGDLYGRAVRALGDGVLQHIDQRLLEQPLVHPDQTEIGREVAHHRALAETA